MIWLLLIVLAAAGVVYHVVTMLYSGLTGEE
jgi:hypothetical protein